MTNRRLIERYNDGWNAHYLDAILAPHTPDMVFENHTAGEAAAGPEVRVHIAAIWRRGRTLRSRRGGSTTAPGHAVCEWTATATHDRPMRRGDLVAEPTGRRLSWRGVDVFTIRDGLVARKDVHSDSVTILRAVGLLS